MSNQQFFDHFKLDRIDWQMAYLYDASKGEYFDPAHTEMGFLEARRVLSDNWQVEIKQEDGYSYPT